MRIFSTIGGALSSLLLLPSGVPATKVACVGDSITAGVGSSGIATRYPSVLQNYLGDTYEVANFGVSGSTMMRSGDRPYWNEGAFTNAQNFEADIVLLMLGTNDAKDFQWNAEQYEGDYRDMLRQFGDATVYAMIPVPLYAPVFGMNMTTINEVLPELVPFIAASEQVQAIDQFEALGGAELSCQECMYDYNQPGASNDGCHPTDIGMERIARAASEVLLSV